MFGGYIVDVAMLKTGSKNSNTTLGLIVSTYNHFSEQKPL